MRGSGLPRRRAFETTPGVKAEESGRGLVRALLVAALGGVLVGLVGGVFRWGLVAFDAARPAFLEWSHSLGWWGIVFPVGLAALAAAGARAMVRKVPIAAGSGVQYVEALARDEVHPAPLAVVPVKVLGGWLGIGVGSLALGREGPTIQIGSVIGSEIARWFRLGSDVLRELQVAMGGAGLAVAFNAPLGGAMFVFEEVMKSFRLRITLLTLVGVGTAVMVARAMLGGQPDFAVPEPDGGGVGLVVVALVFGGVCGFLGALYNRTILGLQDALGGFTQWPVEVRAACVGGLLGALGWVSPWLTGGGEPTNQHLFDVGGSLSFLLLLLAVRWVVGPLSYATGNPGGIFSPLLLVGAVLGCLLAVVMTRLGTGFESDALAMVGMAAFFAAVVRAPFTAVILIAEMTGSATLVLPMLAAAFAATAVATLVGNPPIYDSLRERMLRAIREGRLRY